MYDINAIHKFVINIRARARAHTHTHTHTHIHTHTHKRHSYLFDNCMHHTIVE